MSSAPAPQPQDLSYEKALDLLDQKLRILEEGQVTLEEAMAAVEEARVYLQVCNDRLEEARRRIDVRAETAPAPAET